MLTLSSAGPQPSFLDNPPTFGPAGRVHCNLYDWGQFGTLISKGRWKAVTLSAKTLSVLRTPAYDGSYTFGGWVRMSLPWISGYTYWHNGSNTLNYAQIFVNPSNSKVFIAATNILTDQAPEAVNKAVEILRQF